VAIEHKTQHAHKHDQTYLEENKHALIFFLSQLAVATSNLRTKYFPNLAISLSQPLLTAQSRYLSLAASPHRRSTLVSVVAVSSLSSLQVSVFLRLSLPLSDTHSLKISSLQLIFDLSSISLLIC
jgi:hypothetical protein